MIRSFRAAACSLVFTLGLAPFCQGENTPAFSPLDALVQTMAGTQDQEFRLRILKGMNAALQGRRQLHAPAGWDALYEQLQHSSNEQVRRQAQVLAVVFGGKAAMAELRETLSDASAKMEARQAALEALISARDRASLPALLALLPEASPLRKGALRGLAVFEDPQIAPALLAAYPKLGGDEKKDALAALATRPDSARALLTAVEAGTVARTDLTAPFAHQLQDLNDPAVNAWLKEHWGAVHTSSAEKQKEIARLKGLCTPRAIASADKNHGRALFSQTCALCHTIFGAGAKIGPELPGAFDDVDYLLLNIIDPNAIIGKDYQQTVAQAKNGQTVIGIVGAQDKTSITLKTLAGPVMLQRDDIQSLTVLDVSLMPEGLLSALSNQDIFDLFNYLRQHGQVPALLNENNVNDFNSDTNFDRWTRSSPSAWTVKDGVLTGHASTDRAEFVTSDFVAEDFQLSFEVKLGNGSFAAVLNGENNDGKFTGVRFEATKEKAEFRHSDGQATPVNIEFLPDQWVKLSFDSKGTKVLFKPKAGESSPAETQKDSARTCFAFEVSGPGSEVQLRNLHLEVPAKK